MHRSAQSYVPASDAAGAMHLAQHVNNQRSPANRTANECTTHLRPWYHTEGGLSSRKAETENGYGIVELLS